MSLFWAITQVLLELGGIVSAFWAGVSIGRISAGKSAKQIESSERSGPPAKPICGCGHSLAFHDLKANRCLYVQSRFESSGLSAHGLAIRDGKIVRFGDGPPEELKSLLCGCQHYVGPDHPSVILSQFPPPELPSWKDT